MKLARPCAECILFPRPKWAHLLQARVRRMVHVLATRRQAAALWAWHMWLQAHRAQQRLLAKAAGCD